jgi:hypothetical protein
MVRRALTRLATGAGLAMAGVAIMLGVTPVAGQAAPKAATTPTTVTIVGKGITGKLTVQAADQAGIFNQLLSEVNWLATTKPQTTAPKASKLGVKYTMTILIKDKATATYDLYPEASGGPRAHRPAAQPSGKKVTDGWFYGRLTMSESLRISGVPLAAKADVIAGGVGGGLGAEAVQDTSDPNSGINDFLSQLRQLFLLNGAVVVTILLGLAGISFLIRRKV